MIKPIPDYCNVVSRVSEEVYKMEQNSKYDNDWISVKDRLPEEGVRVLVWYEYFRYGDYNRMFQTYGIGYQYEGFWSGDVMGERARCIAWQPLPAPYEGE